jgi:hypothetical protein
LLGYAGVVIAEFIEVYAEFGDREVKGRMVACDGVCVYRGDGRWDLRFGVSRPEGFWGHCIMYLVWWKWWAGAGMLLSACALANYLVAS